MGLNRSRRCSRPPGAVVNKPQPEYALVDGVILGLALEARTLWSAGDR
jgi:hypothetical protein